MISMDKLMRSALKPLPTQSLDLDDTKDSSSGGGDYTNTDIKIKAASSIEEWLESESLDDNETSADRLIALMIGIADNDKDGEISEDEQGVLDVAIRYSCDYMQLYGVDASDCEKIFNDRDDLVAQKVIKFLSSTIPSEKNGDSNLDKFVFGSQGHDSSFDAVYKKKVVVRAGKKVKINKRVSGTVRLSAKQKMAIKKAGRKSHSATAMMKRMKSMKVRKRSGM